MKKRILLRGILRLRRVASATHSLPPQCNPRRAFYCIGNFLYNKKTPPGHTTVPQMFKYYLLPLSLRPGLTNTTVRRLLSPYC